MIAGLFLSALGGFGAYFFSGGSERAGRTQNSAQVESTEPELPVRDSIDDSKLASLTEPVAEVTAKQISLIPDPPLPPIAEKPSKPAPAPVAKTAPLAMPAPVIAAAKPATPEAKPAPPAIAKVTIPETKPAPMPVAEKLPEPPPAVSPQEMAKTAKAEPAPAIAKTAIPETKPPAARPPELGIEPWQKEKLLQRLRSFPNGTIGIQVPEGNADALNFATALKDALIAGGWKVASLTEVKVDRDTPGLTLSSGTFPPPTEVTTVFSALVSAGIKLSTDLDPSQGKKHPILFVGSRP